VPPDVPSAKSGLDGEPSRGGISLAALIALSIITPLVAAVMIWGARKVLQSRCYHLRSAFNFPSAVCIEEAPSRFGRDRNSTKAENYTRQQTIDFEAVCNQKVSVLPTMTITFQNQLISQVLLNMINKKPRHSGWTSY
jgi:hypothetical protein